ncbi:hypothetical protein [Streptomyces sp. NK15101]|uniref:hypothetical protein n=1 Tax=Streptomyces sp. NK15101 TaxID=2873261 RepID=UPI001CEC114A|nr:hypothetical protein [Streptomyces sp. NK15101]
MRDEPRYGELEESLRAALRGGRGEGSGDGVAGGEESALAAFRNARDTGLHASLPTRDRDDWAPAAERRRPRRSLKAAVAALAASVTLGGVAVATGGLPERFLGTTAPPPEPRPARSASDPAKPGATAGTGGGAARTAAPPGTTAPLRPEKDPPEPPGKSRDALCRAVEKEKEEGERKGEGKGKDVAKGKASASPAWRRLVAAAGGEELVPGYCRYDSRPARTPSAEPRPNGGAGGGDSSDDPGKGAERSRADRP